MPHPVSGDGSMRQSRSPGLNDWNELHNHARESHQENVSHGNEQQDIHHDAASKSNPGEVDGLVEFVFSDRFEQRCVMVKDGDYVVVLGSIKILIAPFMHF